MVYYCIEHDVIYVFHIGIPAKAGSHICDTDKPRYYWEGKAGGYGIQDPFGMMYVKKIDGDYYNIMGLPMSRLYQELLKLGIKL